MNLISATRDKLSVVAVTLFFGNEKKERAKVRGTREFIDYLRRSVRSVAEKVKGFAVEVKN